MRTKPRFSTYLIVMFDSALKSWESDEGDGAGWGLKAELSGVKSRSNIGKMRVNPWKSKVPAYGTIKFVPFLFYKYLILPQR